MYISGSGLLRTSTRSFSFGPIVDASFLLDRSIENACTSTVSHIRLLFLICAKGVVLYTGLHIVLVGGRGCYKIGM